MRSKKTMKLNVKAMAFGIGIVWGAAVLLTGIANLLWTGYGTIFLQCMASVYPGYKASGSIGDLIIGVAYAVVDGGIFGLLLAWLYNRFLTKGAAVTGDTKRQAGVRYPPVEP
jgi:hypothetical protein